MFVHKHLSHQESVKSRYYGTKLVFSEIWKSRLAILEKIELVFKCFGFEMHRTLHSNTFPFILSLFLFFATKFGYHVVLLCLCVVSSEQIFSTIKRVGASFFLCFYLLLKRVSIIILYLAAL